MVDSGAGPHWKPSSSSVDEMKVDCPASGVRRRGDRVGRGHVLVRQLTNERPRPSGMESPSDRASDGVGGPLTGRMAIGIDEAEGNALGLRPLARFPQSLQGSLA